MKMYLVARWGVYVQGLVGVFATRGEAEHAAAVAKARESDGYHDFQVLDMEVGEQLDANDTAGSVSMWRRVR